MTDNIWIDQGEPVMTISYFNRIIDRIKAEIRKVTECPYCKCIGGKCAFNTDCMLTGDHAIEIINKYLREVKMDVLKN